MWFEGLIQSSSKSCSARSLRPTFASLPSSSDIEHASNKGPPSQLDPHLQSDPYKRPRKWNLPAPRPLRPARGNDLRPLLLPPPPSVLNQQPPNLTPLLPTTVRRPRSTRTLLRPRRQPMLLRRAKQVPPSRRPVLVRPTPTQTSPRSVLPPLPDREDEAGRPTRARGERGTSRTPLRKSLGRAGNLRGRAQKGRIRRTGCPSARRRCSSGSAGQGTTVCSSESSRSRLSVRSLGSIDLSCFLCPCSQKGTTAKTIEGAIFQAFVEVRSFPSHRLLG